jgi:uncharacterized protein YihD (DUF1040 family)
MVMRDPKRIDRILKQIEKIWIDNPDLRLMQLLGNCWPAGDHYSREDDELEKRLSELYK